MTIRPENIKILKSEVMLDTPDGGGQATAIEVVDGESNNIFPDIPEASRVYGGIEIRKVYPAVDTESTEALFGAQFLFTRIPEDDRVNVCAFSTKSWSDRRKDAQNRLETYLAEGTRAPWELLERQLRGQRAILVMAVESTSPPVAGQSLVLLQDEGEESSKTQYVRIVSVSTEVREFYTGNGNVGDTFKLSLSTCEISDPLVQDFIGFTPQELFNAATNVSLGRARLRETRVADANNYYSAKKLSRQASRGDATLHVESIYTNIVPSAQSESPMTDLNVVGQRSSVVKGSTEANYTTLLTVGDGFAVTALGAGVYPDTLEITLYDNRVIKDNGYNQLFLDGVQVGTIQYDSGVITWLVSNFSYTYDAQIKYNNAMPLGQSDQSEFDTVTESNRGLIWTKTLTPAPTKGSLRVTYVYSGKHYTLVDQGDGSIRGLSDGVGVGSINYETGSITCTFKAYPDLGSYVLYQWGDKVLQVTEGAVQETKAYVVLDIEDFEEALSGVYTLSEDPTISWKVPEIDPNTGLPTSVLIPKVAVISRSTLAVGGDATGQLTKDTARLYPNEVVSKGTVFTLSFRGVRKGVKKTTSAPITDSGQSFTVSLADYAEDINPWSLETTIPISMSDTEYYFARQYDSPAILTSISALALYVGSLGTGNKYNVHCRANGHIPAQIVGTYDPATRIMSISPQIQFTAYALETYVNKWGGMTSTSSYTYEYWVSSKRTLRTYSGLASSATVTFTDKPDTPLTQATPVTLLGYGVDVKAAPNYSLNPPEVAFRFQGETFALNVNNQVMLVSPLGAKRVVGSYKGSVTSTLEVSLLDAPLKGGTLNKVDWLSVGSVVQDAPKNKFVFYTPLAPLRNGSFQLVIRKVGQQPLIVTPNAEGFIDTSRVWGWVDYETGFVAIVFRTRYSSIPQEEAQNILKKLPFLEELDSFEGATPVTDSPWLYNLEVPEFLYASEISFNAIGLTYLPLSADLLGLDPVRLPADGRVPCFRKGDMVVVTEHKEVEVATPVAGLVVPVGETRLSTLTVVDALGKTVTGYTYNLSSGVVSFDQSFSINGLELPLTIKATIQDLVMLSDVQVSGVLALNKVLSHTYSAGSLVSSVIYIKDMQARAYNKFHQADWVNKWSDLQEGESISATYNTVFYPIQVTNSSAVKERWAVIFTSPTTFRCVGEFVGTLPDGSTSEDYKPINPNTLKPYFILKKEGWGNGGFVNGNVMRFNTDSATHPIYIVRTTLQGESTDERQGFTMQLRGDIDNEEI